MTVTDSAGVKFTNGVPCNANLSDTLNRFYKYAQAQGCSDKPQQFFDKMGEMLANVIDNTDREHCAKS